MKMLDLDYPLPATAIELLLVLVDTAEKFQLETITCREVRVRDGSRGKDDRHLPPEQDPLGNLQKRGLVERLNKNRVRLQTVAFERARYERKNWLGKWLVKMIRRGRSFIKNCY
jgi:hypothetical protein